MHEVVKSLLNCETADSGNDMIAGVFEFFEIAVGISIKTIVGIVIAVIEGIVDDVDFV